MMLRLVNELYEAATATGARELGMAPLTPRCEILQHHLQPEP